MDLWWKNFTWRKKFDILMINKNLNYDDKKLNSIKEKEARELLSILTGIKHEF